AMYVMHTKMLTPPSLTSELPGLWLAGGDALVPPDTAQSQPGSQVARAVAKRPILEVVEWTIDDTTVCRFEFDSKAHRLVRIRARDIPTGEEVTADLGDYKDIGGV